MILYEMVVTLVETMVVTKVETMAVVKIMAKTTVHKILGNVMIQIKNIHARQIVAVTKVVTKVVAPREDTNSVVTPCQPSPVN